MAYQALYRKFRPDTFQDVKGQDAIVTILKNQLKASRIGHAYLFCGTRGTGKTSVAKVFAKAVNCEAPTEDGPCGECEMCRAIGSGASMNVVEIDAASNNRVDDIRQVIEEVRYSPAQGKYKVYIVDEVHMLSTSAFNALLKTLEEPPPYLIFILATTEVHKIPMTILSRCQRYDFKRITVDTISDRLAELLEREGVEAEEKAIRYIAKMADGALRDGLSLLEQCVSFYFGEKLTYENVLRILGMVDQEEYGKFIGALSGGNVHEIMKCLDKLVLEGKDLSQFVSEFVWYLRNLLLWKTSEDTADMIDLSEEGLEDLKEAAEQISIDTVFRYIRILSELMNQMRYAASKRILLETTMIKLCKPQTESDYESLVQRIEQMEKRLESGIPVSPESGIRKPPDTESHAKAKPMKKEYPKAVPEELEQAAKNWNTISRKFDAVDLGMMADVKLSVSENNHLVMVFDEDTPASYFAEEDKKNEIEHIISSQIKKEVKVMVKLQKNKQEYDSIPELREMFGIHKGVKMEVKD